MSSSVTLVLSAALALALVLPTAAEAAPARRATSSRGATRPPAWLTPEKILAAPRDGLTACNYRMRPEGWGALLLFREGALVRAIEGLHAVAWEPGGTRLLVVERIPDDDPHWYLIEAAGAGDDVDRRDLPRQRVEAKRNASFLGWGPRGMVFGNPFDPARRDTLAVPPGRP
jgi:hypothetical protein